MAAFGFVAVAVVLLAGAGWLIGWHVAQATRRENITCLKIVTNSDNEASLRAGLKSCGVPGHCVMFLNADHCDAEDAVLVRQEPGGMFTCIRNKLAVDSFALQQVSNGLPASSEVWSRAARLALMQAGMKNVSSDLAQDGTRFERLYISAWQGLKSSDLEVRVEACALFGEAISQWPRDRDAEKTVALANLAAACASLDVPPQKRLARLLEGYDAARSAMLLQYAIPERKRIDGLRACLAALRNAIHEFERNASSPKETKASLFSSSDCDATEPGPVARAEEFPQANARGHTAAHTPRPSHSV